MSKTIRAFRKEGISKKAKSIIIRHSVVGGILQLIPLPFIDSILAKQVQEHMNTALFRHYGMDLDEKSQDILGENPSSFVRSALTSVVMLPVKRILKKVIFVFTLKGVADTASAVFHDGWLLARAVEGKYLPMDMLAKNDEDTIRALRQAIIETKQEMDTKPVENIFNRAWKFGYSAFKGLYKSLKGSSSKPQASELVANKEVDGVAASVTQDVDNEKGYFDNLDQTFYHHIQTAA